MPYDRNLLFCMSRRLGVSPSGDKRSDRIEAHAKEILGLVAETHDITLLEIASHLERRHGEWFASRARFGGCSIATP